MASPPPLQVTHRAFGFGIAMGFGLAMMIQRWWWQKTTCESASAAESSSTLDTDVPPPNGAGATSRRPEPAPRPPPPYSQPLLRTRIRSGVGRSKSYTSGILAASSPNGKVIDAETAAVTPAATRVATAELHAEPKKLKDAAGDSDSDDDNTEAKLPRDLLSPVPRDQATTIVVFGADGNLAEKKLLPTLFELWQRDLLPADVLVVGYARAKAKGGKYNDTAEFRQALVARLPDTRAKHHHQRAKRPSGEEANEGKGDAITPRNSKGEQHSDKNGVSPADDVHDDPRLRFVLRCHYVTGAFDDAHSMRSLLDALEGEERRRWHARKRGGQWLRKVLKSRRVGAAQLSMAEEEEAPQQPQQPQRPREVRMYYLSVPPFLYASICSSLQRAKQMARVSVAPTAAALPATDNVPAAHTMAASSSRRAGGASAQELPEERYVLEKPFGRDYDSCTALIAELSMLKRSETYFIDHYLGKELVMNLLVLRFANVCFGSIWNRRNIKAVQVIFKERIGCEGRAGYFDQYGIIRDVMQNHLLQMVALVAMEQPLSFTAEHIRQEKLKVLNACRALSPDDLVTGQYAGYRDDDGITNKQTRTETFAAAVLHVHNPRWDGVPFVLKAGKALNDSKVELRVQFHPVPGVVPDLEQCVANELVVVVQPEPAIYWKVQNKVPGLKFEVEQVRMDLLYAKSYMGYMPEAYERLLLEALVADHSHFVSEEELTAQWRIFTPVLQQLASGSKEPETYSFGGRGPKGADALARRYGMTKFGGGLTPYVYLADKALEEAEAADAAHGRHIEQPWQGSGAGFLSSADGGGSTLKFESAATAGEKGGDRRPIP